MTKRRISGILMTVLVVLSCISVNASNNQVIIIPANQKWTTAGNETRTGNYSYVRARNDSVYPVSGTDNFAIIQCKITNSNGTLLCNKEYYKLDETADSATKISIREGYLTTKKIYFKFRGNTEKPAKAVVSYWGL